MTQNSNIELVVAFSTAGSPEEARDIATALVTEELAAFFAVHVSHVECSGIISGVLVVC